MIYFFPLCIQYSVVPSQYLQISIYNWRLSCCFLFWNSPPSVCKMAFVKCVSQAFLRQLETLFCIPCKPKTSANLCCDRQEGKLRPTACVGVWMYYLYAKYNRNIASLRNALKKNNRAWAEGFFCPTKGVEVTFSIRCHYIRKRLPKSFGLMGKIHLIFPPVQWRSVFVSLFETYFVKNCQSYSECRRHMCS